MITGVIYKYTSPSGKSYIGQTTRENYRRRMWFGTGRYTGGKSKIDRARRKYGSCNFLYEILFKKEYNNVDEATRELNILESYFIGYYDTYKNGYNSTLGGDGSRGYKPSYETRIKISKAIKGLKKSKHTRDRLSKARKGVKMSQATKDKLSKIKLNSGHKIIQYSLDGVFLKLWANIDEVATVLNVSRESIAGCCRDRSKTAHKYMWRYYIDGEINDILPKKRRKDCRIVLQLDLNGNLIQEFPSIQDAADSVGVSGTNISACCRGKVNKIKGFKWRYKNDNIS